MKIVLIGATGTIGQAVAKTLSQRHELVCVSRGGGDLQADIASPDSLRKLFEEVTPYNSVVCAAGETAFGALSSLSDEDFQLGLGGKLMGQVNLVRLGLSSISDGGSFTLTSGVLSQHPSPGSASISLVNAAVEGFARAAALELSRGVRINVVSPPWVCETLKALGRDPSSGLPASVVAKAYVASVEGRMTGAVLDAKDYA